MQIEDFKFEEQDILNIYEVEPIEGIKLTNLFAENVFKRRLLPLE